jgi:16S rRNA (guanine966-N2)-methyltransferase
LRIIAGVASGVVLDTPKTDDVRPTLSRSREALFSSLGSFSGEVVLDLFSGVGSLGLEAASRGADKVIFVESNKTHIEFIKRNIDKLRKVGVKTEFKVVMTDVNSFLKREKELDSVTFTIADPPYKISAEQFEIVTGLESFATNKENILCWEVPDIKQDVVRFISSNHWKQVRLRHFGGIEFRFYKVK